MQSFLKQLTCEFLGTAFLLATVVGSGILADKLSQGNIGVALLAIAFATGAVLTALIVAFGGISSHFNPVVTLIMAIKRQLAWKSVIPYIVTQIAGATVGVILANLMFDLPAVGISDHVRSGAGQWLGEFIATFGLIGIILGTGRSRPEAAPWAVGGYVAGAIWFTSSTCFANPAVTIARMFTNTITGIRPDNVVAFIGWQLAAAIVALALFEWLFAEDKKSTFVLNAEKALQNASRPTMEKELVGNRKG